MSELTEQLKTARCKRYYDILRLVLVEAGPQIIADAQAMAAGGRLTVLDVGKLAVKHDLNFKAVCEWLEENKVLPAGTYERLKERGLKANEVLEQARLKNYER